MSEKQTTNVAGTIGYETDIARFTAATLAVDFFDLHSAFVLLFPIAPGRVLDVGAGIGRDANAFAQLGHDVVAIEPARRLLAQASESYGHSRIRWVEDALPELTSLRAEAASFDFVLASAVWHHLNHAEQLIATEQISRLLKSNGIFALSLRHGPAGVGKHMFPTRAEVTIKHANKFGLKVLTCYHNEPSLLPGKQGVTWTRLAFTKLP